jgi:hypothetical protein
MRAKIVGTAAAALLALMGIGALAQELVATPDAIGGAPSNAGIQPGAPPAFSANGSANESWRYRWFQGRWWYWTPENHWMWYTSDRRWVDFSAVPNAGAGDPIAGAGYYAGPYYAGPRYYPGVAVGVLPYGNVNVGVGARIGVDVCGPHGGVRVGRIAVGW